MTMLDVPAVADTTGSDSRCPKCDHEAGDTKRSLFMAMFRRTRGICNASVEDEDPLGFPRLARCECMQGWHTIALLARD